MQEILYIQANNPYGRLVSDFWANFILKTWNFIIPVFSLIIKEMEIGTYYWDYKTLNFTK